MSLGSAIRRQEAGLGHDLAFGAAALALASLVFVIDTFTNIEGAIAVLYSIALLFGAQALNRASLTIIAALFAALTLFSYVYSHASDFDLQSAIRLTVALAALLVTTMLLLKTETARMTLLAVNTALGDSERRYRSIFDRTRVALWERDYSELRDYLMSLKARGSGTVRALAADDPGFLDACLSRIHVVAANEAAREMLGPETASVGALRRSILPGQEKFLDLLQIIQDGGRVFEDKVAARTDSGEEKLLLLNITFPEDPAAFNRVVVSMVDITQRELAQKALADAQAELAKASKAATVGAMSASLAHELNQPLGAIVVNAQTLLRWLDRDPPDLASVRRSAERIIRDSQRASDIIQNTRGMLSQQPEKPEAIDIGELIDETLALMDNELQRSATDVVLTRGLMAPVVAVRIELQQVLINLITNAIQAMEDAGSLERRITIAMEQPDGRIRLAISDTGPGIAVGVKDKLFSPFFTTKPSGLGMGLSICRTALEARGGTLQGHNGPEGGAVFVVDLPNEPESLHA